MNNRLTQFYRFLLFLFLQVLVFNQLEFGYGIHIMAYPLFIMLLPFYINIFLLLFISFLLGLSIDIFSNTYGLHASSALIFAYLRPLIFEFFGQREKYDPLKEPNFSEMGAAWFLKVYGLLIFCHHIWFFLIEIFRLNEVVFILRNSFVSLPFSMVASLLLSLLLFKRKSV